MAILTSSNMHLQASESPNSLMAPETTTVPATIAPHGRTALLSLAQQAQQFMAQGTAPNTQSGYARDWAQFSKWCEEHDVPALPARPEVVACYLTDMAIKGRKVNTLMRHMASIAHYHKQIGQTPPTRDATVQAVLAGICRSVGINARQVEAFTSQDMRGIATALPNTLLGKRDRALLLLGFAGAFRRSELIAMNIEDLHFSDEGVAIHLRRTKTDQEGIGRWVGIPHGVHEITCPVRALHAWFDAAGITSGSVFRGLDRHMRLSKKRLSQRAIGNIVKRAAEAVGLDPTRYSGHSLRAGHCTSAARAGAPEWMLMRQTGHRSAVMVQRYIRQAGLFQENSANLLGL